MNAALLATTTALGCVLGLIHFHLLRQGVGLLMSGQAPAKAAALAIIRIVLTGLGLALFAWLGAVHVLAGFVGFFCARVIAVRMPRDVG